MAWLLDTNILSEIRRLKPEPKVLAFVAAHPLDDLYISTVTLAELRSGIELLSEESSRRDELNNWLTHNIDESGRTRTRFRWEAERHSGAKVNTIPGGR
jgi:predicted nucleic acid-binding protein